MSMEASLKAALSEEFQSYIKNANHSIQNLSDNGDLETFFLGGGFFFFYCKTHEITYILLTPLTGKHTNT